MANQPTGPKVEKINKGGKAKADKKEAQKEQARLKTEAKAEKRAAAATAKEEKKALRTQHQEEAKKVKLQKKQANIGKTKDKIEKPKKVKIAREDGEIKVPDKKKKLILAGVAIVLLLLVLIGIFLLVRMLLGGREDTKASLPESSSLSESSSETPSMTVGSAGGSEASSKPKPKPKDKDKDKKESSKAESSESTSTEKESSSKVEPSDKVPTPEEAKALSAETAKQAVEGSVGAAEITTILGSGAVPPDQVDITESTPMDQLKPGQVLTPEEQAAADEAKATAEAKKSDASGSSTAGKQDSPGTALTSPTETQKVPDFKFSESSLNLPKYNYSTGNAMEYAVHRDIGEYLDKKDSRPGVQITSVVIGGTIAQPDGSIRVLAYAWGSRYAIAENTLFDYGSLVGPCALDYRYGGGQYILQKITLARGGDAFESSVKELCGDKTSVADKMIGQSYDLELRGQMLRNVSSYIKKNSIPVDFFRASGQVYNKNGTIYVPPEMKTVESSKASSGESSSESSVADNSSSSLEESYKVIQDMPE